MLYDIARPQIETGDIIAVREKHGTLSPFTRFFTHSDYTHNGIAIWLHDGLWMAELNGGRNHIIPISQLSDIEYDVYECPVEDRDRVEKAITDSLRVRVEYGFAALIPIGLLNFLNIKVFLHARQILVCSGYCVAILEAAGWPEHSRIISPKELVSEMKLKLQVRPNK